jgi:hypothetical protein
VILNLTLDEERTTWLAIDLSPDRKFGALVGAQRLGDDNFGIKLLHTWENQLQLDDKAIANDLAVYARKYQLENVLYSGVHRARSLPALHPLVFQSSTWMRSTRRPAMRCWALSIPGACDIGRIKS